MRAPKKKGPPPIEIPKEQALQLAEAGWPKTAIAAFFHVSTDTLYRRIPAAELDAAYEQGTGKLLQAMFTRAMGGRMQRTLPDGTIEVYFLKSSDRLLKHALDRRLGHVPKVVEMNPDPDRPANVTVEVSDAELKAAIARLETEY